MQKSNRRVFMLQVIAGSAALAATQVYAADEKVTEEDPYARSMGFKTNTNNVDKVKYKRHDAATQQCAKCQLYDGAAGSAAGPCSFFGGREVPNTGWCRNFKPKAAA